MAQQLVRLKTYADQRDISIMTLRRFISEGKIAGYRFGEKIIMVDMNEADAVLFKRIPTAGGQ